MGDYLLQKQLQHPFNNPALHEMIKRGTDQCKNLFVFGFSMSLHVHTKYKSHIQCPKKEHKPVFLPEKVELNPLNLERNTPQGTTQKDQANYKTQNNKNTEWSWE